MKFKKYYLKYHPVEQTAYRNVLAAIETKKVRESELQIGKGEEK